MDLLDEELEELRIEEASATTKPQSWAARASIDDDGPPPEWGSIAKKKPAPKAPPKESGSGYSSAASSASTTVPIPNKGNATHDVASGSFHEVLDVSGSLGSFDEHVARSRGMSEDQINSILSMSMGTKATEDTMSPMSPDAWYAICASPPTAEQIGRVRSASGCRSVEPGRRYSFADTWTFYYDPGSKNKKKIKTTQDYADTLVNLGSFDSVQGWWQFFNNININQLPNFSNLMLFKNGIKPIWETPENEMGGKWVVPSTADQTMALWAQIVMSVVGHSFTHADDVTGIVVGMRPKHNNISVWNKDCTNGLVIHKMESELKEMVSSVNDPHCRIRYQPHQERKDFQIVMEGSQPPANDWQHHPQYQQHPQDPHFSQSGYPQYVETEQFSQGFGAGDFGQTAHHGGGSGEGFDHSQGFGQWTQQVYTPVSLYSQHSANDGKSSRRKQKALLNVPSERKNKGGKAARGQKHEYLDDQLQRHPSQQYLEERNIMNGAQTAESMPERRESLQNMLQKRPSREDSEQQLNQ